MKQDSVPFPPRRIVVAAAVIRRRGCVLLASRPEGKPPAGWEFPGGKCEAGENLRDTVRRELMEELGVSVIAADPIYRILVPGAAGREIEIHFLRTMLLDDESAIRPCEHQMWRWVELKGAPPPGLLAPDRPVWNFFTGFSEK